MGELDNGEVLKIIGSAVATGTKLLEGQIIV